MQKEWENKINVSSNKSPWKLLKTRETAEVLRVSRRTVEELGKRYEKARRDFSSGEPQPSCPRFGLRRTLVTVRKHFFDELDITEFLNNCRRESDGLEPASLNSKGCVRDGVRSKATEQTRT
jgi:hypothetical protein